VEEDDFETFGIPNTTEAEMDYQIDVKAIIAIFKRLLVDDPDAYLKVKKRVGGL